MPRNIVTTIVTAATVRGLTDLATVQDDWGISGTADDGFLSRAITRCSRAAEQFCNRVFALETVQDMISLRRDPWPGAIVERPDLLQLTRWPIVTIASVTVDGTVLTEGADFVTDQAAGQLQRLDANGNARAWTGVTIVAIYTSGYNLPGAPANAAADPLPDDINDAVSRMVYTRYAERQRDPLIKNEFVDGVGRIEYLTPNTDGNLSADIADLLENYRVPVVV
jgi:hypothetical protein